MERARSVTGPRTATVKPEHGSLFPAFSSSTENLLQSQAEDREQKGDQDDCYICTINLTYTLIPKPFKGG